MAHKNKQGSRKLYHRVGKVKNSCIEMKDIKIAIFSFFCVLAFCSCQNNNYSELIVGTWELDKGTSYVVRHNKREYFDEYGKNKGGNDKYYYRFSFSDASTRDVRGEEYFGPQPPKINQSKYHIDGDNIYIEGTRFHIVELNKTRMILEEYDDEEESHVEFHKINNDKPQQISNTQRFSLYESDPDLFDYD